MKSKFYQLYGVLLIMAACLTPGAGSAQNSFQLNGNGGQADLGNNCFRLTQAAGNQYGSAWWRKKADLTQDFDLSANLNFGTLDGGGADGIVFAFQNVCTNSGGIGGGIGIANVSPSVFVEFDTWSNGNYNDPAYDHVGLQKNGDPTHNTANTLVPPVGILSNNGNVETGQDFLVHIVWTHADTTLKVYVNGDLRINYSGNIINSVFSGSPYVYWGFTAATGGSYNLQAVCMVNFPNNTIKLDNITICQGEAQQVFLPGASSYNWSPGTNISSTSVYNPVLSPTSTTTYYVTMTDACNNVQTDSIKVTVNPLPSTQLTLPFIQKCTGEPAVTLTGGTPGGGIYSGAGVSGGQFTPSAAGAGPHYITYAYTDNNGCTGRDSSFVAVAPAPNVSLSAFSAVCVNSAAFALTGGSPAGGTYSGTGVSNGNFNPATAGAGTHTITYTYTDGNTGCQGTASKTITVNALPAVTIGTPAGTVLCSGASLNLTTTAVNGVSYQWLQNGSAVTTLAAGNTSYTVTATGNYSLYASGAGCTNTSNPVTVTSGTTPTATITSSTVQFCPGASVTLTSSASGSETIQWFLGANAINGATTASYVAGAAGAYKAVITSASGCTANSNTINLTQLPGAVATASSALPAFCPGTSSVTLTANTVSGAQYQWLNNNAPVSGATGSSYSATAAGVYSVVVSLSGCADTSTAINLGNAANPAAMLTTADSSYCAGTGALSVTATSGATYVWKLDGNTINGSSNTLAITQPGAYQAIVTSADQCSAASNIINMTEVAAPAASISASATAVCSGTAVTLTAATVAGATYQWQLDGNALGSASSTNTYSATQGGVYTCIVNNGCSATSNAITITVSTAPSAVTGISGSSSICVGGFDNYSVSPVNGATSYTWSVSPAGSAFIHSGQGTTDAAITFLNQDATVSVVVNNACGSSAPASKAISIDNSILCNGTNVAFGASPTNTCTGSTVTFYNYSSQAVAGLYPVWNFGAGATPATSTAEGPVTVVYSSPGFKTVSLTYNDFFGNEFDAYGITDYINISGAVSTSAISGNTSLNDCTGSTETYTVVNTAGSTYNWTLTGGSIVSGQGTNSVTVNFSSTGSLSVEETNTAGCVGAPVTLNVSCPASTGISNMADMEESLSLYPNPSSGLVTLQFTALSTGVYSIGIYNMQGEEVLQKDNLAAAGTVKVQLDLSTLPGGIYLLKLQGNAQTAQRKITLQ